MLELAGQLLPLLRAGRPVAVATVTRINGSAPRTVGTAMAVTDTGAVIGSISGGCVEGAVYEVCQEVLATGVAVRHEFGYSDDDAFAVGLACGGRIEVVVERLADVSPEVLSEFEAAADGRPAGLALVVGSGSSVAVAFGAVLTAGADSRAVSGLTPESTHLLLAELAARIAAAQSGLAVIKCEDGPVEALFVVAATAPRMIIFGAVDFSAALSNAASLLGYRVTICDARPVFATATRFPSASEVIVQWPATYLAETEIDARTVVCVLTHDDKFDIPLLEVALALPIAYVGAMGSRRTHKRRLEALRLTVAADQLALLHSPIGLDIGASTPEETAISILAEIVATRNAATGASLKRTDGPIHRQLQAHARIGI